MRSLTSKACSAHYPRAGRRPAVGSGFGPVAAIKLAHMAHLVRQIQTFGALPETVTTSRAMLTPDSSISSVTDIITWTARGAKVLSVANSTAYGFTHKITDLTLAVSLMGLRKPTRLCFRRRGRTRERWKSSTTAPSGWNRSVRRAPRGSWQGQRAAPARAYSPKPAARYRPRGALGRCPGEVQADREHRHKARFGGNARWWALPTWKQGSNWPATGTAEIAQAIRFHHEPELAPSARERGDRGPGRRHGSGVGRIWNNPNLFDSTSRAPQIFGPT